MSTVFFKVTPTQDREIKKLMSDEGYTSKAEFFRFLLKFYKYQKNQFPNDIAKESMELKQILSRLEREGKLKDNLDETFAELQNQNNSALPQPNEGPCEERRKTSRKA